MGVCLKGRELGTTVTSKTPTQNAKKKQQKKPDKNRRNFA